MTDVQQARIEAACEAYKNPRRMVTNTTDGRHRDCMEAALEAADAVVTVEQIERAIMGRTATAGAKAVMALLRGEVSS